MCKKSSRSHVVAQTMHRRSKHKVYPDEDDNSECFETLIQTMPPKKFPPARRSSLRSHEDMKSNDQSKSPELSKSPDEPDSLKISQGPSTSRRRTAVVGSEDSKDNRRARSASLSGEQSTSIQSTPIITLSPSTPRSSISRPILSYGRQSSQASSSPRESPRGSPKVSPRPSRSKLILDKDEETELLHSIATGFAAQQRKSVAKPR